MFGGDAPLCLDKKVWNGWREGRVPGSVREVVYAKLERLGCTQTYLARQIGIPSRRLNKAMRGHAGLSAEATEGLRNFLVGPTQGGVPPRRYRNIDLEQRIEPDKLAGIRSASRARHRQEAKKSS